MATLATWAHCWLMFSRLSTNSPRSFSTRQLSSHSSPSRSQRMSITPHSTEPSSPAETDLFYPGEQAAFPTRSSRAAPRAERDGGADASLADGTPSSSCSIFAQLGCREEFSAYFLESHLIFLDRLSPGSGPIDFFRSKQPGGGTREHGQTRPLGAATCHQGTETSNPAFVTSLLHCWQEFCVSQQALACHVTGFHLHFM